MDGSMSGDKFYNYIQKNFNLDSTASRLVSNIIKYTKERKEIHFSLHPAVAHKRTH
jgi:hypothetical protein